MIGIGLAALLVGGCTRDRGEGRPHDTATTVDTVPVAPFIPQIKDGEVTIGLGGELIVTQAPAGATVELYLGRLLATTPCAAPCSGVVDPELYATATAGDDGAATFELDGDYDDPRVLVWEAKVIDPVDPRVVAYTEALIRHASLRMDSTDVQFGEVTVRSGLTSTYTAGNTHTGGVAFVDVNNDYLPDIFILSGANTSHHFYLNVGGGQFEMDDARLEKPFAGYESAGVAFADIDNDHDLDVFVAVDNPNQMISYLPQPVEGGPNILYVNDGTGHFVDRASTSGYRDPRGWRNSNVSLADYDRDGCIDVYALQWAMAAPPGADNFDRLLRGNCDGTFTDVTSQFGLDPFGRDGLGLLWWDADFDLYPEIYVANNSDTNEPPVFDPRHDYWKNVGGTSFENWTTRGDPTVGMDGWAGMGMDIGDIDGDGDWDLYITDVWELPPAPHGNVLYLGEPDGTLGPNVCQEKGVCYGYNSWPTNFMDFDNDGWVDLWVGSSLAENPSLLYLNRADGSGEFYPVRIDGWSGSVTRAGVSADFDADGDVDVFIWSEGAESSLWENRHILSPGDEPPGHHWLEMRLLGTESNWAAVGARIEVTSNGRRLLRRVSGGDSAHSQTDLAVHFGLGADLVADAVDIYWPSGIVQHFEDVATDRFWLVDENAGLIDEVFTSASATWDPRHKQLTVSASTNYLGRTAVDARGVGSLVYDVDTKSFSATFEADLCPDFIQLETPSGLVQFIPVPPPPL